MDNPDDRTPRPAQVTDVDVPISSMAWWLVKLVLAFIPAAALLFLFGVAALFLFGFLGQLLP